jgi:hypothetical protein
VSIFFLHLLANHRAKRNASRPQAGPAKAEYNLSLAVHGWHVYLLMAAHQRPLFSLGLQPGQSGLPVTGDHPFRDRDRDRQHGAGRVSALRRGGEKAKEKRRRKRGQGREEAAKRGEGTASAWTPTQVHAAMRHVWSLMTTAHLIIFIFQEHASKGLVVRPGLTAERKRMRQALHPLSLLPPPQPGCPQATRVIT